jgi:hypothetical protein
MIDKPVWSILVATLGQRRGRFKRLVDVLAPQLERHDGAIELVAYWNVGEVPLSVIRQSLMDDARGTYISFIDDDDLVPYYFTDEVIDAIARYHRAHDRYVDYVGWQMQAYIDGDPLKPTFHSLRYGYWWDDDKGFYRDISHLNPIYKAKVIEAKADFRRTAPPEDVAWSDQLRGYLRTEAYVDRVMYHYHASVPVDRSQVRWSCRRSNCRRRTCAIISMRRGSRSDENRSHHRHGWVPRKSPARHRTSSY